MLVGIAIYEGKIESVEDCVVDYSAHEDISNVNWYKLKIKHALSKTTGLEWPGPREPLPATMREVMTLNFAKEPGASFLYKPDPQIIVYLLEEIYGLEITELLKRKLLSCFENKVYEWDRNDIEGMKVSIQMLDEFGQLILNKGMLHGKRVFSETYYEQMITASSQGGFPEYVPYGFSWWIENNPKAPYFSACGFGGQKLVVVPQQKMIIVLLSDMDKSHPENKEIVEMALAL